jgi:beta-lactamase regulating signal transducer with metallopeptidase domain
MIAQALIHSLWQSLLIAAFVWGMLRLAKRWSAESRYWVWMLALVGIAVLPLSILMPHPPSRPTIEGMSVPPAIAGLLSEPTAQKGTQSRGGSDLMRKASDFVASAWLAMVAWRLLILAMGANTLRHWRQNARAIPAGQLPVTAPELRGCEVMESTDVTTPLAMGIWRPCVLLPQGLASRLEQQQLRSILLHELTHIQRGDVRLGVVQRLIEAMYFYNPVVHWVSRQIERERETSCDDRAIRAISAAAGGTGAETAADYAECLIEVSRQLVAGRTAPLAVGAFRSASELKRRVHRLLDRAERTEESEREDTSASLFSISAAGSAIACALVTLTLLTPTARADDGKRVDASTRDVDKVFVGDGTLLIMAARNGNLAEVKRLLAEGADVNLAALGDGNPLIMASAHGHLDVAATLVSHGARVNEFVPDDETPLINAARNGQLRLVGYLIDSGADVNLAVMANGRELRSPLSEARKHHRSDVVELLLNRGARH